MSHLPHPAELDFPGKDVAESYHPVEVVDENDDVKEEAKHPNAESNVPSETTPRSDTISQDEVSGQQVLLNLGVSIRPKTNILRQAPANNIGLEVTVRNLSPKISEFISVMNNITFEVLLCALLNMLLIIS